MNLQVLMETVKTLISDNRGLLAIDESNGTCNKRFGDHDIPQTKETRRAWRELILSTPRLGDYISGVILYDETIRQQTKSGSSFVNLILSAGMLPGIKVDTGTIEMEGHPGEKMTQGLDGLRERLAEYAKMGARFAKWRAVFAIANGMPSRGCIEANAQAMARYAALSQEAGLVPIVEPEVLMQGDHTLARCREVTEEVLRELFIKLYIQEVALSGLILKPSMVTPGQDCLKQATLAEIVDATVDSLLQTTPASVPVIAFLSGGQSGNLASSRLNAMNIKFKSRLPWPLSFSFARAIQHPALEIWSGHEACIEEAQHALLKRAKGNQAARQGTYTDAMSMDETTLQKKPLTDVGYSSPFKLGKRPKFILGNWKMHGSLLETRALATAVIEGVVRDQDQDIVVAVFPPFPYLSDVADVLRTSSVVLGAQNLYPEIEGAFTGEVSPRMLLDIGCQLVIIGHSERRQLLGETNQFINKKVSLALASGLQVVLCIGETLSERAAKQTENILNHQLMQGLDGIAAEHIYRLMIAYEPIWAIGSHGQHASPKQAQLEQNFIRYRIGQMYGEHIANSLVILYGGSVNLDNAKELFNTQGLDGVLIGTDSLHAPDFLAIIQASVYVSMQLE